MKTRRYSEARIFQVLQEVDAGCPVVDAARRHGVSPITTPAKRAEEYSKPP